MKSDDELFEAAFDYNGTDLRYQGGIECLYTRMAAALTGKSEDDFQEKAEAFLAETGEWHEKNRWNFQIHPDWRKALTGL